MKLTKEELHRLWSTGEEINGYRVNRTPKGTYYLQSPIWKREKYGFRTNIKLLNKILVDNKVFYTTIQ